MVACVNAIGQAIPLNVIYDENIGFLGILFLEILTKYGILELFGNNKV